VNSAPLATVLDVPRRGHALVDIGSTRAVSLHIAGLAPN
jgi:hypothetical protein